MSEEEPKRVSLKGVCGSVIGVADDLLADKEDIYPDLEMRGTQMRIIMAALLESIEIDRRESGN